MNNYLDTFPIPLSEALAPLQPLSFISVLSIPFLLLFLTLLTLDGYHFIAFITLGFLAGAAVVVTFILSGQLSGNDLVDKLRKRIGTHEDASHEPNGSSVSLSPDGLGFSKPNANFRAAYKTLQLCTPELTAATDSLLELFIRDFVLHWWACMNPLQDTEFQTQVRVSMNAILMNLETCLLKRQRNDLVLVGMYAVANSLIIHMRENRALETSTIPVPDYILSNPQSPFAQYLPRSVQYTYLRDLSSLVIRRLLPSDDLTSPVLTSLLRELLTSQLFEAMIETCSDPDWINMKIVDYLSEMPEEEEGEASREEGDMGGFVDVVEKAAEELIESENGGEIRARTEGQRGKLTNRQPVLKQTPINGAATPKITPVSEPLPKQAPSREPPPKHMSSREPITKHVSSRELVTKEAIAPLRTSTQQLQPSQPSGPLQLSQSSQASQPPAQPLNSSQSSVKDISASSTWVTSPSAPQTPSPTSLSSFPQNDFQTPSTSSPPIHTRSSTLITTTPPSPASSRARPFSELQMPERPMPVKSLSSSSLQPSMRSFGLMLGESDDPVDGLEVKSRRRGFDDDDGLGRPRGGSDASINMRDGDHSANKPGSHRRTFSDEIPVRDISGRATQSMSTNRLSVSTSPTPSPTSSYSYSLRSKPSTNATATTATTSPPPSLIYPPDTIHFNIMDISPQSTTMGTPLPKQSLLYMIQIERPATPHALSDGGGYVITRNYTDFENIHVTLVQRYPRRMAKLRLPLDRPGVWRRGSVHRAAMDGEEIGRQLEGYLMALVEDPDIGRDQIIAWFLRKEASAAEEVGGTALPAAPGKGEKKRSFAVTGVASRAMSLLTRGAGTSGSVYNGMQDEREEFGEDEGRRRPFLFNGEETTRSSLLQQQHDRGSYTAGVAAPQGLDMKMGLIAPPAVTQAKIWGRAEDGISRERMRREPTLPDRGQEQRQGRGPNGENSNSQSSVRGFAALVADESAATRGRPRRENGEGPGTSNGGDGGDEKETGRWWNLGLGGILGTEESDDEAAPVRTEESATLSSGTNGRSRWSVVGGFINSMLDDSDDDGPYRERERSSSSSSRGSASTAASSVSGAPVSTATGLAIGQNEGQMRKRRITSPLAEQVIPDEADVEANGGSKNDNIKENGNANGTRSGSIYKFGGILRARNSSSSLTSASGSSAGSSSVSLVEPVAGPQTTFGEFTPAAAMQQLDSLSPLNQTLPAPVSAGSQYRMTPTARPLSAMDLDLLIETSFALIEETFHLSMANNRAWLRRTALNLLKEVLRRSYTETISRTFLRYLDKFTSIDAVLALVKNAMEAGWPDGKWRDDKPVRTREEKERTKWLAREILIEKGVPAAVRQVVGEQNCVEAMERLWERCQRRELNRVLVVQVVEAMVRTAIG